MRVYHTNGTGFKPVEDDYICQAGEVIFAGEATHAELMAAFPGYEAAKLPLLKDEKLGEIKALLDATDAKYLAYADGDLTQDEYKDVKALRKAYRKAQGDIEAAETIAEAEEAWP